MLSSPRLVLNKWDWTRQLIILVQNHWQLQIYIICIFCDFLIYIFLLTFLNVALSIIFLRYMEFRKRFLITSFCLILWHFEDCLARLVTEGIFVFGSLDLIHYQLKFLGLLLWLNPLALIVLFNIWSQLWLTLLCLRKYCFIIDLVLELTDVLHDLSPLKIGINYIHIIGTINYFLSESVVDDFWAWVSKLTMCGVQVREVIFYFEVDHWCLLSWWPRIDEWDREIKLPIELLSVVLLVNMRVE